MKNENDFTGIVVVFYMANEKYYFTCKIDGEPSIPTGGIFSFRLARNGGTLDDVLFDLQKKAKEKNIKIEDLDRQMKTKKEEKR